MSGILYGVTLAALILFFSVVTFMVYFLFRVFKNAFDDREVLQLPHKTCQSKTNDPAFDDYEQEKRS